MRLHEGDREYLIQEVVGLLTAAKPGLRLAKHDMSTVKNKISHRMSVASGKSKAGSHWSSKGK